MQIKLDENLPLEAAVPLREAGHDVMTVNDQGLGGSPDDQVVAVCTAEERALVTLDTDFADIRTYRPSDHAGIVVLRLEHQDKPHVLSVITRISRLLEQKTLAGHLWIVNENRIRIHGQL